jgi:hypothetical protein
MSHVEELEEMTAMDEHMGKEEEGEEQFHHSDSSSTFPQEKSPASMSEDEELSARDSEWEDEIEPTIKDTSQVLLHEWMNGLVIFYNQCLEIGTEGVVCDPIALRQAVDEIVETALEDAQNKMLLGALPLYDFVVTVLSKLWIRMHPCKNIWVPAHLPRL